MKYFKILAAAVLLLSCATTHAQININGLLLDEYYTKEEIISILGAPDTIIFEGYIYFEYYEKDPQQNSSVTIVGKVELPDNESIDYIGFSKWDEGHRILKMGRGTSFRQLYYPDKEILLQQHVLGGRSYLKSKGRRRPVSG